MIKDTQWYAVQVSDMPKASLWDNDDAMKIFSRLHKNINHFFAPCEV